MRKRVKKKGLTMVPELDPSGTESGRISCKEPNLSAQPSESHIMVHGKATGRFTATNPAFLQPRLERVSRKAVSSRNIDYDEARSGSGITANEVSLEEARLANPAPDFEGEWHVYGTCWHYVSARGDRAYHFERGRKGSIQRKRGFQSERARAEMVYSRVLAGKRVVL